MKISLLYLYKYIYSRNVIIRSFTPCPLLCDETGYDIVASLQAAEWDIGLLLVIIIVEIWSCVRIVPMKHCEFVVEQPEPFISQ